MPKPTERQLRICSKYRPKSRKPVPELRLVGDWFRQSGFDIGDRVQITTREKLLIIQPIEADGDIRN
jgi:uncharacterized membrane protein (UPF0127 family)